MPIGGVEIKSKGIVKSISLAFLITLIVISFLVFAQSELNQPEIPDTEEKAEDNEVINLEKDDTTTVNDIDITEIKETPEEITTGPMEEIAYQTVGEEGLQDIILTVSNIDPVHKGFKVEEVDYLFQLIACDHSSKTCSLLINNNPNHIDQSDKLNLGLNYEITIQRIELNKCEKRFCDMYFDVYDSVIFSILPVDKKALTQMGDEETQ